jgi:hypothetical protein
MHTKHDEATHPRAFYFRRRRCLALSDLEFFAFLAVSQSQEYTKAVSDHVKNSVTSWRNHRISM